jgi:hypothetical protein
MNTIPFVQRLSCTIDEACQATGIGRTKLYEEMSAGRVRTTNVGKRRLVLVPSLLQLLAPRDTPPPPLLRPSPSRVRRSQNTDSEKKPAEDRFSEDDPIHDTNAS